MNSVLTIEENGKLILPVVFRLERVRRVREIQPKRFLQHSWRIFLKIEHFPTVRANRLPFFKFGF